MDLIAKQNNYTMKKISVIVPFVIFLVACDRQPKGQHAIVDKAEEVNSVAQNADYYDLDTTFSVITWIGSKPTGQHNGTIELSGGEIATAGKLGEPGELIVGGSFTIDIRSLDVKDLPKGSEDHTKLTRHLMSDDFFGAKEHPTATFVITSVIPFDTSLTVSDKEEFKSAYAPTRLSEFMIANPTHYITGNLTMKGITKSIGFPVLIRIDGRQLKAEAKFNIDRTDWNLSYGDEDSVRASILDSIRDKATDRFIYNTVNVGFSLRATKRNPAI